MDEEQEYKLITCVDPRKINVPIRNRFAKLTLSNKKKQETHKEDFEENFKPIKRASRNLLDALENETTDNKSSSSSNIANPPQYVNPLLRSESSNSIEVTPTNVTDLGDKDGSKSQKSKDNSETINGNLQDKELSALAREISIMSLKGPNTGKNDNIANEITVLVSTESQRMSCEFYSQRLQTLSIKPENNEQRRRERESAKSLCISLSSDESCSAITVTDTSISELIDFDVTTSEIPKSGCSADALLPNTFSNEKADRMEAFLRDVSQQRREIEENEAVGGDSFTLLSVKDTNLSNNGLKNENIYKQLGGLAYADTESMTTFSTEGKKALSDEKMKEIENSVCKNNMKLEPDNFNAPLSMTQINSDIRAYPNANISKQEINLDDSQRLAHDETKVNTSLTENTSKPWSLATSNHKIEQDDTENSIVCSEQSTTSDKLNIPEDSVVISETSSEDENDRSGHHSKYISEEVKSRECSPAVDSQSQSSPQQMGISSINFSAKINIKISITQGDSLENESEKESVDITRDSTDNSSQGSTCNDKISECDRNLTTRTIISDEQVLETTCNGQKQDRSKIDQSKAIENNINEDIKSEEEEDVNFLTHAERLLNQLYGKSWKTPEVIRTLKRSSRTPKKDCTPSPQKSKTSASFKETSLNRDMNTAAEPVSGEKLIEQSVLDDFSIFRRDIVRTNLDSTRFTTPKLNNKVIFKPKAESCNFNSEPRRITSRDNQQLQDVKVSRTEAKRKLPKKQAQNVRAARERWRKIVDENTETSGDNASDDDTLDKTENLDDPTDDDDKENIADEDEEWNPSTNSNEYSDNDEITTSRRKIKQNKFKSPRKVKTGTKKNNKGNAKKKDALVYLDLSKDEVTILEGEPSSPLANNDANFNTRLENILRTCTATKKTKLPATPSTGGKSKRKLFTANFGDEDIDLTLGENGVQPRTPIKPPPNTDEELLLKEMEQINLNDGEVGGYAILNKNLEFIKRGEPIFKVTPPRSPATSKLPEIPKQTKTSKILTERKKLLDQCWATPQSKYGFLKSLDVCVSKSLCDPDALSYRENYRNKKEELAKLLYKLYNEKLFQNKLDVPLQWNKKLCNTAGRCLNKKKMGVRTSVIELSEKVLTSADRLRCTLIHELCHAATWIFSGEGGHGSTWKQWALKANNVFPEIPKIGVCHQYDIEYKYTYKCTLCAAKSHAHSKSKKVENIRCSFCHGAIEIFLNKKDKDGNILPTPVREPTGFAKFVKDNYKQYKRPDLKHADVMKILSAEFAALKVIDNGT